MVLRPYQREAVDAVYEFLRTRDDNPCVVIPTAGGKTPVMATICRDAVQRWGGRVLILAHVREPLEQAAEKLHLVAPDLPVGIYSAGLKRRDLGYAVTIAGIQSVYERACDVGAVDLVIVDECHLIPEDGEGMYRTFLADMKQINPPVRIIGLTATPFRMKSGTICAPENILNAVCFEIGVRELIVQGYLCPLRTKAGSAKPDTNQLHVRGGEFDTNYWKSFVHARLAVPMGDPGCLSLFGRKSEPHRLLAEHLTSEYRVKTEGRGRTVDAWKLRVDGLDNHWLDCLVGCAVAASMGGAAPPGLVGDAPKPRPTMRLSALQGARR